MKISYRIILITLFTLLVIISASSAVYYTVMFNILTTQQSKQILQMSNNFVFYFANDVDACESRFHDYYAGKILRGGDTAFTRQAGEIDFILSTTRNNIHPKYLYTTSEIYLPSDKTELGQFMELNPRLIVRSFRAPSGVDYLFGFVLQQEYFDSVSAKMGGDIGVYFNDTLVYLTNEQVNQNVRGHINEAYSALKGKRSFSTHESDLDSLYIISTLYSSNELTSNGKHLTFEFFTLSYETANLRDTIKYILVLLAVASVVLSFILAYLFTGNLRKQLNSLAQGAEIVKRGNFDTRIQVGSNDEIGKFVGTFNTMLDALQQQERLKTNYTEFLTFINRNPITKDIAESALEIIITTTSSVSGAVCLAAGASIGRVFTKNITRETAVSMIRRFDVLTSISQQCSIVKISNEQMPQFTEIADGTNVKEILFVPIFSDQTVIAILSLSASNGYRAEDIDYLEKISGQLSISLTKAFAYEKLEQIVSELEIQKKKAEELTEVKSRFLATISHELRTPLNSILGLADLLLADRSLSDKAAERLGVINRSGQRLLKLINELLELSKIEAGKMYVNSVEFNLGQFITELSHEFQSSAANKKLSLAFINRLENSRNIKSDREKLFQILSNLISNAIKFTSEGNIDVVFYSATGDELCVEVIDTGIGISADDASIIFEEFRQVDSSASRMFSGSGLGLSIARRLVELLQGRIMVESREGEGSTFRINIPGLIPAMLSGKEGASSDNQCAVLFCLSKEMETIFTPQLENAGYGVALTNSFVELKSFDEMRNPPVFLLSLTGGFTAEVQEIIASSILSLRSVTRGSRVFIVEADSGKSVTAILRELSNQLVFYNPDLSLLQAVQAFVNAAYMIDNDELVLPDSAEEHSAIIGVESISFTDWCIAVNDASGISASSITFIVDSKNQFERMFESDIMRSIRTYKNVRFFIAATPEMIAASFNGTFISEFVRGLEIPMDEVVNEILLRVDEMGAFADVDYDEPPGKILRIAGGEPPLVLIVDDDPDSLFTMSESMKERNFGVLLAGNGKECLEILTTQSPDIILLDIMMPEMDGFQAIRQIKQNKRWADIPVIAVTAKAMLAERHMIYKAGFNGFIAKPIIPNMLAGKVLQLLSGQKKSYA